MVTARRQAALLAVLAVVLATVGPSGWLSAAPSATAQPTPPAKAAPGTAPNSAPGVESAIERFSGCLNSGRAGQLLLMIDESGSLATSDPRAVRVQAARYLLTRLADLADRSGIRLSTGVAGFADRFRAPPSWRPLGRASLPSFTAQVDAFADKNSGRATDYWTALNQARRALNEQAPAAPAQTCQALFWFSDGKLDLVAGQDAVDPITGEPLGTAQDAARAEARARMALCQGPAALSNQLRASGVITFGIGLDTNSRPRDFDLMRSIATGESNGTRCGRESQRPLGEFRLASGIDQLVFGFDDLIPPEPINGPAREVCPERPCAAGRHAFVLDPSVSQVEILGAVDRSGPDAVLVPPKGEPIELRPKTPDGGNVIRGPAGVRFSWLTDRTVSVQLRPSSRGEGWTGEWALVFVDRDGGGGQSRANVHISSDLRPAWLNRPEVLHSEDVLPQARFGLVDQRDKRVDPSTVRGAVTLDAALLAGGAPERAIVTGLDKSRIGDPTRLDLGSVPPGPATLRLTLNQTTAPTTRQDGTRVPGTALPARSVNLPLQIAAPVGYPRPAAAVDFGTGEQATELTGALGVTGPGCVWVPQQQPRLDAAPRDTGRISVAGTAARDAGSCLRLGDGERGEIDLVLRTERPGDGGLSGTVTVQVAPEGEPGAARAVPVTATANLLLPLNQPLFVGVFLAVLLLGVAIPLALLWLFKYLTGRMPKGQVKTARYPVLVRDGQLGLSDGRPFTMPDKDFRSAAPDPGRRRMSVHGVELRTAGFLSPFGTAYVRIRADGARKVVAAFGRKSARLPLAVHNTWFALHDPAGPPDAAEVIVLLGLIPPAPAGALERITEQVRGELPRLLRELRPELGGHPPPGWSPPSGGSPPGPTPNPFGPRSSGNGGAPTRSPFDQRQPRR